MNGGLSNELFVHPSTDPLTKFDNSFISYNKTTWFGRIKSIRKYTDNPHSIEWHYIMKSSGHICPPNGSVGVGEIRKCCWTWPNLERDTVRNGTSLRHLNYFSDDWVIGVSFLDENFSFDSFIVGWICTSWLC